MTSRNFSVGPAALLSGVTDFISDFLKRGGGEILHRSAEFSALSKKTIVSMRSFFEIPDDYFLFYLGSATEAMEIVCRNIVSQKARHIVNGHFGKVWHTASLATKKEIEVFWAKNGDRISLRDITRNGDFDFLAITANETATGASYSSDDIVRIRAAFPEKKIGVDITSSMGAVKYDFSAADAWFFSVQKALGLPAGLGILIVHKNMISVSEAQKESGADIGSHHSLPSLAKKMKIFQTPTTPNILNIAALGFVSETLQSDFETITHLAQKTREKADFFRQRLSGRSDIRIRGNSETIFILESSCEKISKLKTIFAKNNIVVGLGYGNRASDQLRIGNFPVHEKEDFEQLISLLF